MTTKKSEANIPPERLLAEKIVAFINAPDASRLHCEAELADRIASLLREALEKAYVEGGAVDNVVFHKESYEQGVAAERERCAKICEAVRPLPMDEGNDPCHCVEYELTPSMVADKIRGLE